MIGKSISVHLKSQLMVFLSSPIKLTKVREATESLGFFTAKKKTNFSQ